MEILIDGLIYLIKFIGAIGSGLLNGIIQNPIVLVLFIPAGFVLATKFLSERR